MFEQKSLEEVKCNCVFKTGRMNLIESVNDYFDECMRIGPVHVETIQGRNDDPGPGISISEAEGLHD